MNTLKFKTNIKCGACVATVTPHLTGAEGIENWQVDLQDPNRTLTVETDKSAEEVADLVKVAGYQAEPVA
ncbi:heavy-metal-associated domain-containing protein [Persicitalea sp.]|uniref:heavy-metal-associated domain-containing protein n=1 Tax=Persicitalea sp. TaxID=3100273 RepID=UPI0035945FAB